MREMQTADHGLDSGARAYVGGDARDQGGVGLVTPGSFLSTFVRAQYARTSRLADSRPRTQWRDKKKRCL
jgi:hypothetical protein